MSVRVEVELNGVRVPLVLDDMAVAAVAAAVAAPADSPFLSIPEAAEYLRCRRQRVDDLLSARRLTRFKDGARTLVSRAELDAYLAGVPTPLPPPAGSGLTPGVRA